MGAGIGALGSAQRGQSVVGAGDISDLGSGRLLERCRLDQGTGGEIGGPGAGGSDSEELDNLAYSFQDRARAADIIRERSSRLPGASVGAFCSSPHTTWLSDRGPCPRGNPPPSSEMGPENFLGSSLAHRPRPPDLQGRVLRGPDGLWSLAAGPGHR